MLSKFAIHIHQLWAVTHITGLSWHTLTSIPRPLHLSTHTFRGSGYQVLSRNTSQYPSTFRIWCLLYTSQDCHKIRQSRYENESHSVMSDSLQPHGLYSPWNSPGQNMGVGSLSLLQGIFPTQGLNPSLPHCRQILYQLSHKGSPRILEWVAFPFSRGSSQPRNRTRVSCIADRFFTNWAIREARINRRISKLI